MAYQNQNPVTLSAADLSALKTYVTAQQAAGGQFVGYSNAAIAAALNSPSQIANPAPAALMALPTLPRAQVQLFMTQVVFALVASASPKAPQYQYLQEQVNSYTGDTYTPAEFAPFMTQALADGVITQQQAATLTTQADPDWQTTVTQSAWALRALSAPTALQDTDIAAALAS